MNRFVLLIIELLPIMLASQLSFTEFGQTVGVLIGLVVFSVVWITLVQAVAPYFKKVKK